MSFKMHAQKTENLKEYLSLKVRIILTYLPFSDYIQADDGRYLARNMQLLNKNSLLFDYFILFCVAFFPTNNIPTHIIRQAGWDIKYTSYNISLPFYSQHYTNFPFYFLPVNMSSNTKKFHYTTLLQLIYTRLSRLCLR